MVESAQRPPGRPSPLPLFNVVPVATMFVGTQKRPNKVRGGGGGGSGYLKTPF